MNTRLSKAALLVFALSSIINGYAEASTSVDVTAKCVRENSCLNGGTRKTLPNGRYECHCKNGFTGIICETEYQCVRENSCLNGGIRKNLPNGRYECHCLSGFTGIICETGFTGCRSFTASNNRDTYIGNQSWTFTNKPCQRWDSQTPHNHTHTDVSRYDGKITNISQADNYCRNPDRKNGGPWCLTTDPNKRWEYCNIPFCHDVDCRYTGISGDYAGTQSRPDCLRWEDVKHSYTPADFPGGIRTLSEAQNYCRSPKNDRHGLWCYVNTINGLMGADCNVLFCQGCQDGEYDGWKSTTQSGLTCQRWDSQSPHPHNVTDPTLFKVAYKQNLTHVNEAENYCRVVDGFNRTRPWCYTTVPCKEWEYCDVPECD